MIGFRKKRSLGKYAQYLLLSQQVKDNTDSSLWRFLLDSRVGETQQLATIIGLPPMSEAEYVKEHAASESRLAEVAPLVPLLSTFAYIMSGSVMEYLSMTSDYTTSPGDAPALAELVRRITLATSLGAVTQLEDLGLIQYTYEGSTL